MIYQFKQRALTLVELTVVLTIVSIVAFAVAPSLSDLVSKYKTRENVALLSQSLTFARTTAISRVTYTIVCPWNPNDGCHSDWSGEISIFADRNNDKQPDQGEILRVARLDPSTNTITPRPAGKRYFSFSPSGTLNGQAGSFVICAQPKANALMAYLAVNFGGRARTQWDEDGDRNITLVSGSQVTCS